MNMSKITQITLFSNMYVIEDRGKIIIDTGCDTPKEKYVEIFSGLGINPLEINLIVITHGHSDHYARMYELKELTGAPIVCNTRAVQALQTGIDPKYIPRGEEGKKFLDMISQDLSFLAVSTPLSPDLTFDSYFDLNPYGVAGKVIHTPGHSDCSSTVVLDSGEAFCGDMVIISPFTEKPTLALLATDEIQLRNNIEKLMETVHTFYGGHSGPHTKEEVAQLL